MAPPDARRKGLRVVLRYVGLLVVAAVVCVPFTFVGGMMLTPLLWRLEPVLNMELAGHSGPSDWVFDVIFGFSTIAVYLMLLWLTRPRAPRSDEMGQMKGSDELI